MFRDIVKKVNSKIGDILRAKYSSFRVTRPYNIYIGKHRELEENVAVVVGGSGAIGRSCAIRLAAEGAKVYVCGSREGSAKSVRDEIIANGGWAECRKLDVLDDMNIAATLKSIANENDGRIDILINAAGGSARNRSNNVVNQNNNVINEIIDINLIGTILCCKYAARYMINNKKGRIVNITSVIGIQGKAGLSEYAASKGGGIAFIKSLAQELGPYGITVNGVAPGIVQRGEITPNMLENLKKTNWMNSYGTPEDIASLVCFLCKSEASFITGQNIAVDGGRSLGLKEF